MSLLAELKRRNVLRVGAAYVVIAWLVIQVVDTIGPAFGLGDAAVRYVTIAFAAGLIPVLVLSWAFEWTPQGLKREADVDDGTPASRRSTKRLDRTILVVLVIAVAYFSIDKFILSPQREAEQMVERRAELEEAREEGRSEALVESYGDTSIAVLPFRDMSPEGDQAYFSEGIAEELLNLLARESELRVISRTSSFAFKDQALEVPEIARRLKVGHILEGSVRKAGNMVRVTAQLIDARSDTHLWSQTWDRDLSNILAIQDEIAGAVADSLHTVLLEPGHSRSAAVLSGDALIAYEFVLEGRYLLNQGTADAYRRALPFFEQAVAHAPDYASAHSGLAKVLRQMSSFGMVSHEQVLPRIEAALDRALQLDPGDPDALATRGAILGLRFDNSDLGAARDYWRRALASNPSDGDALRWLGWSYTYEDSVRYLEYLQRAHGVAPTNALVSMWLAYALARFDRFGEAMDVLRDWQALDAGNPMPIAVAGDLHAMSRHLDLALRSYYRAFRMAPDTVDDELRGLVWLLTDSLSIDESGLILTWADRRIANSPSGSQGWFQKAVVLSLASRDAEADRLVDEVSGHPEWAIAAARLTLILQRDYVRSRAWWDSVGITLENMSNWPTVFVLDDAFVLQRTGDAERGRAMLDKARLRIEQQMAAGVVNEDAWELAFYAAVLHAMSGEHRQAIESLRRDAANSGLSSLAALRTWPHFDGLRDDPEFQALVEAEGASNADWQRRLEERGLLLSPEEVLASQDDDFDPFTLDATSGPAPEDR